MLLPFTRHVLNRLKFIAHPDRNLVLRRRAPTNRQVTFTTTVILDRGPGVTYRVPLLKNLVALECTGLTTTIAPFDPPSRRKNLRFRLLSEDYVTPNAPTGPKFYNIIILSSLKTIGQAARRLHILTELIMRGTTIRVVLAEQLFTRLVQLLVTSTQCRSSARVPRSILSEC